MGSIDERGYLTLRDRSKDVVSAGARISIPREVEEALLEHRCVGSIVVGAPDADWGVIVVAFVVGESSPAELDAHLLQRIARFKRLKRYLYIDPLPKNSYGKVLKRDLRRHQTSH